MPAGADEWTRLGATSLPATGSTDSRTSFVAAAANRKSPRLVPRPSLAYYSVVALVQSLKEENYLEHIDGPTDFKLETTPDRSASPLACCHTHASRATDPSALATIPRKSPAPPITCTLPTSVPGPSSPRPPLHGTVPSRNPGPRHPSPIRFGHTLLMRGAQWILSMVLSGLHSRSPLWFLRLLLFCFRERLLGTGPGSQGGARAADTSSTLGHRRADEADG